MPSDLFNEELRKVALKKGYANTRRHIFLCTNSNCHKKDGSEKLWKHLKNKLNDLQPNHSEATVARSKTDCLRICKAGPIALVYPEKTLYHSLDENKLDKIIEKHLFNGEIVEDHQIDIG